VVVGQLAPLATNFALHLHPLSLQHIVVHLNLQMAPAQCRWPGVSSCLGCCQWPKLKPTSVMPHARQSPVATVMNDRMSTPSNDAPAPVAINGRSSSPAAMSNAAARNPSRDMCCYPELPGQQKSCRVIAPSFAS